MRTRIVLCAGIVLCLASTLYAADTTWIGPDGGKWNVPANWTLRVPTANDKAKFNSNNECILDVAGAVAMNIAVGDGQAGYLKVVDGGGLTVYDWSIMGYPDVSSGENAGRFTIEGGVVNCQARVYVGFMGEGILTVDKDGVLNVNNQELGVGQQGGSGAINLEGGTINLYQRPLSLSLYNGTASIDFWGGTMTLPNTPQNQDYLNRAIGDGIIKAYNGAGKVVMDPNETPGRIAVRGVHPLNPYPMDGGRVSSGNVELTWVLPAPFQPGTTVTVDVYFGTSPDIGTAATPKIISKKNVTSFSVRTEAKKRYYWAVDAYIGSPNDPVFGPVFSFAADNLRPRVNAGADVVTWLKEGARTGNLDATVTDDGALVPYTVKWTVVTEPAAGAAVIATANAEDTSITLSALGQYVLQLEAFDGEYTSSDTVTINVYNDSCEAAKSLPNYVPLVGDLNGDCRVDDVDLALLQENWLKDNSLAEEWFKKM